MDIIINLYQRKTETIFVTKSMKKQKKKKKRKIGVLKRMLLRDPVDLHFVSNNTKNIL